MIDTGSSVNVLYIDVFQELMLDPMELTPFGTPLSGFTGDTIHPEGKIALLVEIGSHPQVVKTAIEFIAVNLQCVHNAILGRPAIVSIGRIISMPHLCMKYPTLEGVGIVRGDIRSARKCYRKAVDRKEAWNSQVSLRLGLSNRKPSASRYR
ncbi:PREDICTED: uncharacterized protein LOC109179344 [Ipomoea nil]|uniref:uncharacterized protein LOC109179344 n=1 Tax=Ipomoea nil TaxID=35883 RepID=UPI000902005F|nr:PREDICTED: uncharacterized protein LOC109179344 [Ipomoea nil]